MPSFAPFDASKYAFRTNFDGLSARDASTAAQVDDAKKSYQDSLVKFENLDKEARQAYQKDKDAGLTTESFENWLLDNFFRWNHAKAELQSNGARLSQAGLDAYGHGYMQRLNEGQTKLAIAAQQAGYIPENF